MLSYLMALGDLVRQPRQVVALDGEKLLVIKCETGVRVVSGTCPHRGAPLIDGYVVEGLLICPWHRSVFDLETGMPINGPCRQGLIKYPSVILDGCLFVDRESTGRFEETARQVERVNDAV